MKSGRPRQVVPADAVIVDSFPGSPQRGIPGTTGACARTHVAAIAPKVPVDSAQLSPSSPRTARGVVLCAARLGTNDLDETIAWWRAPRLPIWGVVPERVGIAAGPEARLYRDGLAA